MYYSINKRSPYCGRTVSSTAYEGNMTNQLFDYATNPFVFNIEQATVDNTTFRTALWTGKHLQLTVMSINPGEDIGAEVHPDWDQFLRIEHTPLGLMDCIPPI